MLTIKMIVACGLCGEIGRDNDLIWKIPKDLKRFKQLTLGSTVIMGRKTFDSIGRALPERLNIVISKTYDTIPGCIVAKNLNAALSYAHTNSGSHDCWIIGGGQIYQEALERADEVHLTRIQEVCHDADVHFPIEQMEESYWLHEAEAHEDNELCFTFERWLRGAQDGPNKYFGSDL